MGTVGEMLQASVPCSCGAGDLAYGDGYDVFGGRAVSVHCKSCGQTVRASDKQSVIEAWFEANRAAPEPSLEEPSPVAEGGVLLRQVAGTVVYTDLARAAVLLRELADIVERMSRAQVVL